MITLLNSREHVKNFVTRRIGDQRGLLKLYKGFNHMEQIVADLIGIRAIRGNKLLNLSKEPRVGVLRRDHCTLYTFLALQLLH